ncbi:MAG: DUF1294 domain-containing protein [Planctomycetota bacterium]
MTPTQAGLAALAALNLATFLLYGWDKLQARRGARRVPERRLLLALALGGVVGGWAGMLVLRHKTRKGSFLAPAIACSLAWALLAGWLLRG